jgi:hypothetical protein
MTGESDQQASLAGSSISHIPSFRFVMVVTGEIHPM